MPGTRARDYLSILRLLRAAPDATIGEVLDCKGPLYDRLLEPLLLAALNTEPPAGSAKLAAAVIRETLAAGGRNYRPLIARDGLSAAFVDPALRYIEAKGGSVVFGERLRAFTFDADRVSARSISAISTVPLRPGDGVVLAVPPVVAASLVPDLTAPTEFRAIVNAHFRIAPPAGLAADDRRRQRHGRMAVRLSRPPVGHDQRRRPAARHAARGARRPIWREVAEVAGIAEPLPPWQIVRERRATFAALPARGRQAPGRAHALEQSAARRRLDRNRPAGDDRGRDPLRRPGRRT